MAGTYLHINVLPKQDGNVIHNGCQVITEGQKIGATSVGVSYGDAASLMCSDLARYIGTAYAEDY